MAIAVMLVDDHTVLRAGLQLLIDGQADLQVVAQAGSVMDAIAALESARPQVILMDISLPDGDGISLTRVILRMWPDIAVLGLTRHEDRGYLQAMLDAGARGYLHKGSAPEILLDAIRTVAGGGRVIDPRFETPLPAAPQPSSGGNDSAAALLSADQQAVLRLVAGGRANRDIAMQLGHSEAWVAEHKSSAMTALGLRTRIDVIRYSEAQGWREGRE